MFTYRGTLLCAEYQAELDTWVKDGRRPCRFLEAILENHLWMTVANAPTWMCISQVEAILGYLRTKPTVCWGSEARVKAWEKKKMEERHTEVAR